MYTPPIQNDSRVHLSGPTQSPAASRIQVASTSQPLTPPPYTEPEISTSRRPPAYEESVVPRLEHRLIAKNPSLKATFGFKADKYIHERALLDAGAKVNARKIALAVASGARINAVTPDRFRNVLHKVFVHAKPNSSPERVANAIAAVDLVLTHHGDIGAFDNVGKTPLMLARDNGWLAHPQMNAVIERHVRNVPQMLAAMDQQMQTAQAIGASDRHDRLVQTLANIGMG